jgi:AraC family transcriptional regulator, positive regulator of tynA and feaB
VLPRFSDPRSAVAPDERAWRDLLREHFVSLDVTQADGDLSGAVNSQLLGHLQLSTVASATQVVLRSPTLIRRDSQVLMQIGLVRSGRAVVDQDGRRTELGPGDFVLYETSRPFEWSLRAPSSAPRWELAVFTWPRASFSLSESRSRELTARAYQGSSGMSRVISQLLCGLLTEGPTVGAGTATAFVDQLTELLSVALLDDAVPAAPGALAGADRLLGQADDYIDHSLANPDLNPEAVARAVSVSTRQLHRIFAGREMTVMQTIRLRRLEGARRELMSGLARDRSLREIARNWGFLDVDVFSRAFRQAYGISPRQYRAQQCPRSRVTAER